MIKSPPIRNFEEYIKYVNDNDIPRYMTHYGKYSPTHYPCLVVWGTNNRKEDELEYIYLSDFNTNSISDLCHIEVDWMLD